MRLGWNSCSSSARADESLLEGDDEGEVVIFFLFLSNVCHHISFGGTVRLSCLPSNSDIDASAGQLNTQQCVGFEAWLDMICSVSSQILTQ